MANTGYIFRIGKMVLPYAPSELNLKLGSNNSTVQLINGSEINILKDPKLREISFEVDLPRGRQYPFANKLVAPKEYIDYFNELLDSKTPIDLIIAREVRTSSGSVARAFDNDDVKLRVNLEEYSWVESAENAYDMKVSLTFKEYIEYGTVKHIPDKTKVETTKKDISTSETYTVKKGDCLWNIARKFYGNGNALKYTQIYAVNKDDIEREAKKNGKKSSAKGSTKGWWIYPGTKLTIPRIKE